jgi:hypothetical protein
VWRRVAISRGVAQWRVLDSCEQFDVCRREVISTLAEAAASVEPAGMQARLTGRRLLTYSESLPILNEELIAPCRTKINISLWKGVKGQNLEEQPFEDSWTSTDTKLGKRE